MFRYGLILLVTALFSNSVYKEIKIHNPDSNLIDILHQNGIHIDHAHFEPEEYLIFVASEDEVSRINSLDFSYEILIDNVEEFYQSRLTDDYTREFGLGSMGGYYTFEELVENLDELYNEYPQFVKEKISIGNTLEGRDIWAIKLSDNPNID